MATKPFKPTDRQKAEVRRIITKWKPLLFLGEWKFDIEYSHYPASDDGTVKTAAEITAILDYKDARITVFPIWFDHDGWQKERLIVHEMCHCVTETTRKLAREVLCDERFVTWNSFKSANEVLTQHVTNIAFSLEYYNKRKKK